MLPTLWHTLKRWFSEGPSRLFAGGVHRASPGVAALAHEVAPRGTTVLEAVTPSTDNSTPAVPYDEALLERARTQWQFGDWPSLAALTRDTLQHHPDRAKLALLAAAGHQQVGDTAAARQFTRLAQDWGCSKKLVAQVLIAGAHNTLARVAAAAGQVPRALKHFQESIATGTPNTDLALATQARVGHQWQKLGLPGGVPALAGETGTALGLERMSLATGMKAPRVLVELTQANEDLHQQLAAETQARQAEAAAKAQAQKQLDELLSKSKQTADETEQAERKAADLQRQVDSALGRMVKLQLQQQFAKAAAADAAMAEQLAKEPKPAEFKPKCVAEFNLGEAWAGNTVNTVIFRHHGIFTHQGHQFTSFYVDEHTLRFVCRRLSDDQITTYDLLGDYNLKDAHNSISMGVDRQGYLHVCYDHHASKLRYRRSLQPMRIDGWTDDLPMTGQYEDRVTYPTFILPRAEHPLTLLYRDGTHNKGSARLKYYDEQKQAWIDKPTPILSGAEQRPWTSNAYWNHPAIGRDGSLHLSFVWRTGVLGAEQLVNNINIGYAWSPDNGHHWYTLQGQPYQLPITPTTAETIWPVSPGSNLINQCSMALDAFNRPHIVFYANDAEGIPQYQHLRYDGKTWHHQYLSQRAQPFNLSGGGTLQIPISRPEILLDAEANAVVIYRGDLTNHRMAMTKLYAPNYEVYYSLQCLLSEYEVGYAEPMLDREGWNYYKSLSILLQYNDQPDHDGGTDMQLASMQLREFYK